MAAIAAGMRALESNDFAAAEASFKASVALAVAGQCPGPRALEKCRSYFLAAKVLRECRRVSAAAAAATAPVRVRGRNTHKKTSG